MAPFSECCECPEYCIRFSVWMIAEVAEHQQEVTQLRQVRLQNGVPRDRAAGDYYGWNVHVLTFVAEV